MAEDTKFRWDQDRQAFVNRVSGEAIPDDEPVIIFRARDWYALDVLRYYQSLILDDHHKKAVAEKVQAFQEFTEKNIQRMKEPGITHDIHLKDH